MVLQSLTKDFLDDISVRKLANKKLIIGMTTRNGGESTPPFSSLNLGLHVNDNKYTVIKNRETVAKAIDFSITEWVCADQVHGSDIVEVSLQQRGKGIFDYEDAIKATDGMYTKQANLLLTAAFADCVPLFFAVENPAIVGIAHAGWKGTTANIARKMIEELQQREHVKAEQVHVYIGPSIGPCCYEVDDKVIAKVKDSCTNSHRSYEATEKGYMLNLKELNKQILLEAGVSEQHISVSSSCTSCDNDLFFSHRKEKGSTGRMLGFIGMKQED
jgi:polyphenol oxidase